MISLGSFCQMFVPLSQFPHVIALVFTVILFRNVVVASPNNPPPPPPTTFIVKAIIFHFKNLGEFF